MFNLQSDSNFIALNERFQCELIVQDNEPELLLLKVLKFVASSYTTQFFHVISQEATSDLARQA